MAAGASKKRQLLADHADEDEGGQISKLNTMAPSREIYIYICIYIYMYTPFCVWFCYMSAITFATEKHSSGVLNNLGLAELVPVNFSTGTSQAYACIVGNVGLRYFHLDYYEDAFPPFPTKHASQVEASLLITVSKWFRRQLVLNMLLG